MFILLAIFIFVVSLAICFAAVSGNRHNTKTTTSTTQAISESTTVKQKTKKETTTIIQTTTKKKSKDKISSFSLYNSTSSNFGGVTAMIERE